MIMKLRFAVTAVLASMALLLPLGIRNPGRAQGRLPDGSLSKDMIDKKTQSAIDAGLAYLEKNQGFDGSFGTGQQSGSVAITSLGGLAFMAGGHQPGRGRYGKVVTRAIEFILKKEDHQIPGYLVNSRTSLHGPMYGHGFATLFLAEAYGMIPNGTLRKQLRGTLERAVQLIINSQNHEGGWRYQPIKRDADISVTICQIMALRAARNAGISVPKVVADRCTEYVKRCQNLTTGGFNYQPNVGGFGGRGFARTAAGVVALYNAGHYKDPAVKKGLEFLMDFKPGRGFQNQELQHYYYGHYYAAQAMWIAGGQYWKEWYPAIRDELVGGPHHNQIEGYWSDNRICPHYSTAMALIILQIPNNYLPILQR
jgi:hypothetical protein